MRVKSTSHTRHLRMTNAKVKLRFRTALRSRPRHERPHNKKDGRTDKQKHKQVSHGREKDAVSQTHPQSQPTRPGRSRTVMIVASRI